MNKGMSIVTQIGDEAGGNRSAGIDCEVAQEVVDAAALLLNLLADDDGNLSSSDRSLLKLRETGPRLDAIMKVAREF